MMMHVTVTVAGTEISKSRLDRTTIKATTTTTTTQSSDALSPGAHNTHQRYYSKGLLVPDCLEQSVQKVRDPTRPTRLDLFAPLSLIPLRRRRPDYRHTKSRPTRRGGRAKKSESARSQSSRLTSTVCIGMLAMAKSQPARSVTTRN